MRWLTSGIADAQPAPAPAPAASMSQVLVVDDDPTVCAVIGNFLASHGVEPITAVDGVHALELFDQFHPRLVISDWSMPTIDGLELCRRIRARSGGNHVHFIMLTMHAQEADLSRAFDAGVDDFLAKPFDSAAMMARLRAGLRAVSLYDEISQQHQGSRRLNEQLTNLNQRLEKLAITDDLTGLYNRRQAMHRLEEHWAMCDRYKRPVSVVSIDVDHFKLINDKYGHSVGDHVLRGVAESLKLCVRNTDMVARVGGEEFLVVLPYQTLQEADVCAERCRVAVSGREFEAGAERFRVTISAGIACRRSDMLQCVDLLRDADEALYAAKRGGRNTVRAARTEPPTGGPEITAA